MGNKKEMDQFNNGEEYAKSMTVTALNVLKVIGMIILGVLFVISIGFVVQLLWNWLMPELFDLKKITYWQGMGILVFAKILFGGIGGGSSSSKSPSKEVKGVVAREIRGEMEREFQKEYQAYKKDATCNPIHLNVEEDSNLSENADQDALYDKWWQEEGEKQFEAYLNKRE